MADSRTVWPISRFRMADDHGLRGNRSWVLLMSECTHNRARGQDFLLVQSLGQCRQDVVQCFALHRGHTLVDDRTLAEISPQNDDCLNPMAAQTSLVEQL